ncbi:Gyrb_0 protein [Plakobranchus ocellatus]|uniref:Gyrb_0 protein n=1 Tax=Plakobranchus ocellatus TaxID=259542 RepID=A0AAV3Z7H8_9GAST|nr:Gyrb_0 protein [Plakobranchus ocellatus]
MSQEENRKRVEASATYQPRWHQMRADYRPVHPIGHPHTSVYRHDQPNPYWFNQNYPGHPSFRGPRHFYPMHQMFRQHGPFGNSGNQFLPAPHFPNAMRFPPNIPSPHFNGESRRNRNQYHYDMDCAQDLHRYRGDSNSARGRTSGQDRYLRCENGQGARPKTTVGKCQKDKTRGTKKRNYQNSSPIMKLPCTDKDSTTKSHGDNPESCAERGACSAVHSTSSQNEVNPVCVQNGVRQSEFLVDGVSEHHLEEKRKHELLSEDLEVQGAVGGIDGMENVESSTSYHSDQSADPCLHDKNLIDEGAICDLDGMFRHQEFSRLHGNVRNFLPSDDNDDADVCDGHGYLQNTDSVIDKKVSNSEEDSYSDTQLIHTSMVKEDSGERSLLYVSPMCSPSKSVSCFPSQQRDQTLNLQRVNNAGSYEVDDVEDTGDFIDTDLPAQCLLSSSDEMDNASSSEHEDSPCLINDCSDSKFSCSDINSNELPNPSSNLLPEALKSLSIGTFENHTLYSSLSVSSQDKNFKIPVDSKQRRRQCNTYSVNGNGADSSDSENDDSTKVNGPICSKRKLRSSALDHCGIKDVCGDGAAASQVLEQEFPQRKKGSDTSLLSESSRLSLSPPGADSEVFLPSQQCFISNTPLNVGATQVPSDDTVPIVQGSGPCSMTVSYEPSPADACSLSSQSESTSCSTTANGGACCPPGHQQAPASEDLSGCCQGQARIKSLITNDGAGVEMSSPHNLLKNVRGESSQQSEGDSYSASSYNAEMTDSVNGLLCKKDRAADGSGPEDPSLSHDSGDTIDMVLLPMEEEIEPVLRMGTLLCGGSGGGGAGTGDGEVGSSGLAAQGLHAGGISNLCEDHDGRCALEQGHLRGAVPSKEFYELIKTVSTTDSYMRFYDKDGHDVQREVVGSDDEQMHEDSSKAERLRVDRVMIWNEYEAYVVQFKQIAVSACGQTAVLNVLKALKIPCEKSAVCKVIQGSLRKEDADIPDYLFSRAVAGTTAEELMAGIETLSAGTVGGRFFPFWPPRKIKLLQWLAYWMKRGAIPMATLNLQQGPHSLWQVPDSWHHQMVYGVSHQGLYLTNPLEIVSERSAMKQLCSDSVLMVRRQDIISRYRKTTDLGELLSHPDPRWSTMNVLGQVVNVLREFNMPSVPGYRLQVTSHISIPACYKAGITLFMRKDKAAWSTLLSAPDLPIDVQGSNAKPQQIVTGAGAL